MIWPLMPAPPTWYIWLMQEIHVMSSAIGDLRTKIAGELTPVLKKAHTDIDDTSVSFPAFGALGQLVFGTAYSDVQNYARQTLQNALDTLSGWDTALAQIEKNWLNAEDKSSAVYR